MRADLAPKICHFTKRRLIGWVNTFEKEQIWKEIADALRRDLAGTIFCRAGLRNFAHFGTFSALGWIPGPEAIHQAAIIAPSSIAFHTI